MNINEYSFLFSSKESNNDNNKIENKQKEISDTFNCFHEKKPDIKQMNLGIKEKENELEEMDETDNLKYNDNYNKNLNPFLQQRLDSFDSRAHFKYSIDIPNVSKQRLHEYLNDDLLNALDYSPNIPKLNSNEINNNISNEQNDNNNPNDLLGFSLYSQPNNNNNQNLNNKNENNINNLSDFSNMNNIFHDNNNYNYNNIQNFNFANNNNLNYNINNPPIYIPTKLRNNEYNNNPDNIEKNKYQNYNNYKREEIKDNNKNKLDNRNRKNAQNIKKDKNNKKFFEVRAGDWTCVKCNNLNFSFRNKCNRCGLPKELNAKFESMNTDILNPNINYPLMNEINNSNEIYMNNIK